MMETIEPEQRKELLQVFEQNWGHIRHWESLRIWCLNIYFIVVIGLVNALVTAKFAQYFQELVIGGLFITIVSLLIVLKIEGTIEDYSKRNRTVTDHLNLTRYAGGRVTSGIWKVIRMRYSFPAFYSLMVIGFIVLLVYQHLLTE